MDPGNIQYLISVEEARKIILENTEVPEPIHQTLEDSFYHVLASDIYAPYPIPSFRQSSVDGYALRFEDYQQKNEFFVEGESPAGYSKIYTLKPNQALRVFTGGLIPEGADTMVMQEKVGFIGENLIIQDPDLKLGNQVRQIGSEIQEGSLAMKAGKVLGSSSLGYLANIGISELAVYPKPRISILITGNELESPGKKLKPGKVFESNSYSLNSALESFHFPKAQVFYVPDNLDTLSETLENCLWISDIIIFTGGVSVGDYDFTPRALDRLGFKTLFHKVKQRPGKPFLFAKKGRVLVFGLPGNPGSVLTGFYQYIIPCLEKITGLKNLIPRKKAILNNDFKKIKGLTFFVRAWFEEGKVHSLGGQESYKMGSYSEANCLIEFEEDKEEIIRGEEVNIFLIP